MQATPICRKRLLGEIKLLNKNPHKYIDVSPDEKDLLTWYFLVKGPEFSDFKNGYYIGKILHNPEYPLKPPDFLMLTPNGRFNINAKICLSNSSYHPDEWSAMWNIPAILTGFLSIMLDDKENGISHIQSSKSNREQYAKNSIEYNKKNHMDIIKLFTRFMDSDGNPKPESNITSAVTTNNKIAPEINKAPEKDNKPPEENKPPEQDNKPPEQDNKPQEQDNKAPEQDNKAPEQDNKPPEQDNKPPEQDNKAPVQDNKAPEQDNKAPEQDNKAPEQDNEIINMENIQSIQKDKKIYEKGKRKTSKKKIKHFNPDELVIEKSEKTDEEYKKIILEHNSNKTIVFKKH